MAIPSVDMADYTSGDPARKNKFVAELGKKFSTANRIAIYLPPPQIFEFPQY